jgi:hypothetical protein
LTKQPFPDLLQALAEDGEHWREVESDEHAADRNVGGHGAGWNMVFNHTATGKQQYIHNHAKAPYWLLFYPIQQTTQMIPTSQPNKQSSK